MEILSTCCESYPNSVFIVWSGAGTCFYRALSQVEGLSFNAFVFVAAVADNL